MGQRKINQEIRKYFKLNNNCFKTYENVWDTAKVKLREKFIAFTTHINKVEKSKINDLKFYFKKLEQEKQNNNRNNF